MGNYILYKPHIVKISINGKFKECIMSMARNAQYGLSSTFFESTDEVLIEKLRPYIPFTHGGELITTEEIPEKLRTIVGYEYATYNLGGEYVKRYNDFYFYHNGLIANINGVEYLEAVPYAETGIWYIDKNAPDIVYIDDMNPILYKEIRFLCKYDSRNKKFEEGWEPNVIGERIKNQFFIKYNPQLFPTVHYNH